MTQQHEGRGDQPRSSNDLREARGASLDMGKTPASAVPKPEVIFEAPPAAGKSKDPLRWGVFSAINLYVQDKLGE